MSRKNCSTFGFHAVFLSLLLVTVAGQGCSPPSPVANGYYSPQASVYDYNSNVTYHCDSGYVLDEEVNTRRCESIRLISAYFWSGNSPSCIPISCSAPEIPNARFDAPDSSQYATTVSYECSEGLVPLGTQTAECLADGTWSFVPCQKPAFACSIGSLPTVPHATHNATASAQQPSGTRVSYTCARGYTAASAGDVRCVGTEWLGTPPTCQPSPTTAAAPNPDDAGDKGQNSKDSTLLRLELPIIAGVGTALILTTLLLIGVYCMRKRRQERYAQKASSVISSTTTSSSGPTEISITPNQSFRLPRHSARHPSLTHADPTPTHYPLSVSTGAPPALPLSQPPPSTSSPVHSAVSSANTTASEAEFHTIRECLGDFRNNNNAQPLAHTHSCPKLQYGQQAAPLSYSRTVGPNARPMWVTAPHYHHHTCGRATPYEMVTCPHGVEHVYQPLEHVYEEPRIWMQPLPPNPHNH